MQELFPGGLLCIGSWKPPKIPKVPEEKLGPEEANAEAEDT